MSQALFTSITGLKTSQDSLSVISNNVSNINTTSYKASSTRFETLFSNTITAGTAPSKTTGGTNPEQIGLGVQIGSITRNFTSGSFSSTGRTDDLYISGNGYFTVMDANGSIYLTRDGNFSIDANGCLCTASGYKVVGSEKLYAESSSTGVVQLPQQMSRVLSGNDTMGERMLSSLNNGTLTVGTMDFTYAGAKYSISADDIKAAMGNGIDISTTDYAANMQALIDDKIGAGKVAFSVGTGDNAGSFTIEAKVASEDFAFAPSSTSNIAKVLNIDTVKGGTTVTSDIVDYKVEVNPATSVDNTISLASHSYGDDGSVTCTYSNGDSMTVVLNDVTNSYEFKYTTSTGIEIVNDSSNGGAINQVVNVNPNVCKESSLMIQMVTVTNEAGLTSMANNLWQTGPNAGAVTYTVGNQLGAGFIQSGGLESSNVDLATELSNMIVAQRAVSANSRVFSAASSVLESLTSLGR